MIYDTMDAETLSEITKKNEVHYLYNNNFLELI